MKPLLSILLCVLATCFDRAAGEGETSDPFADDRIEMPEPRPGATVENPSFKEYRGAVMKLKSMHEKKPFASMESTVEKFLRIVGKKRDDLKLVSGGSKWDAWDGIYEIKIGHEVFTLHMEGIVEGMKDDLGRSVYTTELIRFNVGQLDSPFAFETLWEWRVPTGRPVRPQDKGAEQDGASDGDKSSK